jgi:hypothetical protein
MTFSLDGNTITIEQGSTFSLSVNYTDSSGSTINLSSYSARMQCRVGRASSSTVFSLTSGSEITLGSSDPNLLVTIPATTTAAYDAPLRGVYDLEIESSSGVVTKLLKGTLLIEAEVTR